MTSALVGLAIEHGYLGSVDDRLADYTFELVPETAYSSDDLNWTVNGSRVNREHDDESLRDIALVADSVDAGDRRRKPGGSRAGRAGNFGRNCPGFRTLGICLRAIACV